MLRNRQCPNLGTENATCQIAAKQLGRLALLMSVASRSIEEMQIASYVRCHRGIYRDHKATQEQSASDPNRTLLRKL